jgi:hypothetical protein
MNYMKKALVIAFLVMGSIALHAQDVVKFEFSGGIEDAYLKTKMEQQVSNLLTAINRAENYGTDVNYSGIDIDNLASQSIGMMWNNVHMRIRDNDIREVCLRVNTSGGSLMGYQVRNIAVTMIPTNADYNENINQEICIGFDTTCKIIDFNLTVGQNHWEKVLADGARSNDLNKRLQIMHWIEQLRNAFCQKDYGFVENVFTQEGAQVGYNEINKQQFLNNLRHVFVRNDYVNVEFDDIEIVRHGVNPNIYGVTMLLQWTSGAYSDKGWLFSVWDFTDEYNPKILIRTWQDMKHFSKDEVFKLQDFTVD